MVSWVRLSDVQRTVLTGLGSVRDKGRLVAVEGRQEMGRWAGPDCNRLTGWDPGTNMKEKT